MKAKKVFENISFEKGKGLEIGLKHKKYPNRGDIVFVWNKIQNEWQRMESVINPREEFTTTYEIPDLIMSVKNPSGSWTLEAIVIWNEDKKRWEYLSQLRESQNFERKGDVKKSLVLGLKQERTFSNIDEIAQFVFDNKEAIKNIWRLDPFVDDPFDQYIWEYTRLDDYPLQQITTVNRNVILSKIRMLIYDARKSRKKKKINESLDFERGKDIKNSLNIGKKEEIIQKTKDHFGWKNIDWDEQSTVNNVLTFLSGWDTLENVIVFLKDLKKEYEVENSHYSYALDTAISNHKLDTAEWLFNNTPADINYQNNTILRHSIINDDIELVEWIIEHGGDGAAETAPRQKSNPFNWDKLDLSSNLIRSNSMREYLQNIKDLKSEG